MYLKSIQGVEGQVLIPSMGATIGTTVKWSLHRREDRNGPIGIYTFRAVMNYLNPHLFNETAFSKEVRLRVGKDGKVYRLEQVQGASVDLQGPNLVMEEVSIWPVEEG